MALLDHKIQTSTKCGLQNLSCESRPRWLRHFFFFEQNQSKVKTLEWMTSTQPKRAKNEPKRTFEIYPGDFNSNIHRMLSDFPIPDKEAAFCLLDQRTFECKWSSVKTVATHKRSGNKIELFYFLANSWMDRSISVENRLFPQFQRFLRSSGHQAWALPRLS
jgi:three-Cys-motif partner protein